MFRISCVTAYIVGSLVFAGAAIAQASCPSTTPEQNSDLVRRFVETVYNGHNPAAIPEFLADDFNRTNPARPHANQPGLEDDIARVQRSLDEFPDLTGTIDQMIAADDMVVTIGTHGGTHSGDMTDWEAPATGRTARWNAIQAFRIECGKIAEAWVVTDRLTQLRQLGVISDEELATVHPPTLKPQ